MTMTLYRNFAKYEQCILLVRRMSNVECLTLLFAIGVDGIEPNHFIDGSVLERDIVSHLPRLSQFNFHIRSILKNASHVTVEQIRQSCRKPMSSFGCTLDRFKNKFSQCQIYSLPFIGTRLDFISNRFPLFDVNKTFTNVTTLLLFDDVKPFESIFFERLSQALPRLKILEIINQLEQQDKKKSPKINVHFPYLAVLILYDIHYDYAELFLCELRLPSLAELAINKNILFQIIAQNHPQARENCSKIGTIRTSEPSYHSIDIIRDFFPIAKYYKFFEE